MREKNIRQNLNSLLNRISPKWDTFSNINKNINDINKNSSYWFTGIITVNYKFKMPVSGVCLLLSPFLRKFTNVYVLRGILSYSELLSMTAIESVF